MAKLALINRNEKRKKLVAKFAKKRDALQAILDDGLQRLALGLVLLHQRFALGFAILQ